MRISTLPVYSKLAAEQDLSPEIKAKLPTGWHLSAHQVATYQALKNSDADVVFNVAMTGDGKSLAGQLPALVEDRPRPLMAMYPTNELIGDQLGQIERSLRLWGRDDLRAVRLDARRLDNLEDEAELERRDALLNLWHNHELVLTNPDIFHYVMQQYYIRTGKNGDAPDRVIGQLLQSFDQFTFDEFHVFQAPQVVSVVNALIFIHEITGNVRPKQFLFLSATPEELLLQHLDRAGLRWAQINGTYAHAWNNPDPVNWRRILHGSSIHFAPQSAEEWVGEHLEDTLLKFFLEHRPGAKGAIIVNSVASVQRLVARLRPVFAVHGLTVEPNTGFDASERRRASYDADLLVGTSTIDIGVDFQINFLVFESRDAGTFLQRLGRLGRHNGFSRGGAFHQFEIFEAHALVPPWLYERLFQAEAGTEPPLAEGVEIDRERLSQIIHESFPQPATFAQYGRVWGGLQAAQIIKGLYHPTIKGQYTGTREQLAERYRKTLQVSLKRELARLIELQKTEPAILEEARSFRGGGDLLCGILDENETGPARIKKYDLFGLLANFRLGSLEKDEFFREVRQWQLPHRAYKEEELVGYFRVSGPRPERTNVQVIVNQDLNDWGPEKFGVVRVLNHVEIDAPEIPELTRLNRALRQRKLVALLCLLHPAELARRLRLPWPFPLYRFCSRDGCEGSIAFGRQALLLAVALQNRPDLKCGGEGKSIIV
jgi:CRISPR-associated endonuclease/helicase Cas3